MWNHYEAEITAQEITTAGNLSIYIEAVGRLYLDMVSLFPQKTFMQQRNGLRADIATLLADLKPRFMRFPGGCLVHDGSINAEDRDSLYRWKNTIGVSWKSARQEGITGAITRLLDWDIMSISVSVKR